MAERHPRLNLLNLEVVAATTIAGAVVALSSESANGILPGVLDDEGIPWRTVVLH